MKKEDINDVILFQIDKTSKISKQYTQREFDRLGFEITVEQWVLLKIIEENTPLSQKELAQKSFRDPASITRTLHVLEKKNFIRRENIPNNRRQYNIQLTEVGKGFVNTNIDLIKQYRKKSTDGLTAEELQLLRSLLLKIQQNMS